MNPKRKRITIVLSGIVLYAAGCAIAATDAPATDIEDKPKAEQADAEPQQPPPKHFRPPPEEGFGKPPERGFRSRRPPFGSKGPGRPDRPGAMLWRNMSEEERDELKSFMAEYFPERYDEMLELQEIDEGRFSRHLGRMIPEMMRLRELSERDPELFEVRIAELKNEFELRRLARRFRHSGKEAEREKLRNALKPLVEKQFDLRQRRMELEIVRMEKKVYRLRKNIERRAENREAEITETIEKILRGGPPHSRNPRERKERP